MKTSIAIALTLFVFLFFFLMLVWAEERQRKKYKRSKGLLRLSKLFALLWVCLFIPILGEAHFSQTHMMIATRLATLSIWPILAYALLAVFSAFIVLRVPSVPNERYLKTLAPFEAGPIRYSMLSLFFLSLSATAYLFAVYALQPYLQEDFLGQSRSRLEGLSILITLLSYGLVFLVGTVWLFKGARTEQVAPPLPVYLGVLWLFILGLALPQVLLSAAFSWRQGALVHGVNPLVFALYLLAPALLCLLFALRTLYTLQGIRRMRKEPRDDLSALEVDEEVSSLIYRIEHLIFPDTCLEVVTPENLLPRLEKLKLNKLKTIGHSRKGHPVAGYQLGVGDQHVSILAGAHADEPVGPITACLLPTLLAEHFPEVLERYTFFIIPHINPDGAENNAAWQSQSADFPTYVRHVVREMPGDDLEFGFGDEESCRPESRAAMNFFKEALPCAAHFSLHGMPFAEGAWFLINKENIEASKALREQLLECCRRFKTPLHDIDRKGEKGFSRIEPGFCTTPESAAMRAFFLDAQDPEMADRFHPSSMEWVRRQSPACLAMVSEAPFFLITQGESSLEDPIFLRLREALKALGDSPAQEDLDHITADYGVTPLALSLQIKLQLSMILLALHSLPAPADEAS